MPGISSLSLTALNDDLEAVRPLDSLVFDNILRFKTDLSALRLEIVDASGSKLHACKEKLRDAVSRQRLLESFISKPQHPTIMSELKQSKDSLDRIQDTLDLRMDIDQNISMISKHPKKKKKTYEKSYIETSIEDLKLPDIGQKLRSSSILTSDPSKESSSGNNSDNTSESDVENSKSKHGRRSAKKTSTSTSRDSSEFESASETPSGAAKGKAIPSGAKDKDNRLPKKRTKFW